MTVVLMGSVGSPTGAYGEGAAGGSGGAAGGGGGVTGGVGGCVGGVGGGGGEGAQHLVVELPVSTSKNRASPSAHPPSLNGTAQSGHGHVSPTGIHEPPVDAQQYVPVAHRPMHDVARATVVQEVAQRGYASAAPVSSLVSQ